MKARPTILGLMGVIAFVAVGMAALRTNDELWAAGILALTVSALCTASLVAIYHRGAWAGFAVFGWAQFLICQPHSDPTGGTTPLSVEMAYRLLRYVNSAASFGNPPNIKYLRPGVAFDGEGNLIMWVLSHRSGVPLGWASVDSVRTGLCLSCIIVGLIGAIVGSFVAHHCVASRDVDNGVRPV
jgi:hypothetical protein